MKTMIGLAVCLAMGPVAAAQDAKQAGGVSHDAMKILKASEAALKKVTVVRYQASYKGTKWIEAMVPAVEGTATIGKRSKWDVDPFFVEVKLTSKDADAPIDCKAGPVIHAPMCIDATGANATVHCGERIVVEADGLFIHAGMVDTDGGRGGFSRTIPTGIENVKLWVRRTVEFEQGEVYRLERGQHGCARLILTQRAAS